VVVGGVAGEVVVPWIRAEAGMEIPKSFSLFVPAALAPAGLVAASIVSTHATPARPRARARGTLIRAVISRMLTLA
jgi:hypothetical protein